MNRHLVIRQFRNKAKRSRDAFAFVLLGLWAMAGLLGCAPSSESQEDENEDGYPLLGVVEGIDLDNDRLTVAHEEIPGFMEAMTMVFRVHPGEVKLLKVGDRIKARLVRDEDGGFRLIKIWKIDEETAQQMKTINDKLIEKAKELPSGYYLAEGDDLPKFALIDQHNELVTVETLKGKAFVLNYIFTRCTDANMCPLSTSKMARLQKMVAEKGLENVAFVSVTLDPKYDTPGVLRAYADMYGIDGSNYHFVTGPREAVRELIRSLGVTAFEKDDTILHSLATVVVAPDGKIVLRSDKSAWDPEEFLEKLTSVIEN